MALYVPLSRRRRNAALVSVATLLVGLVIGFVVGRSTGVTASERAAEVRTEGDTLGTRLEALTIEYEQAVNGTGDTIQGGVIDALDLIDADLDQLINTTPWLGKAQARELRTATANVANAARAEIAPDEFARITTASAAVVRDTLGI